MRPMDSPKVVVLVAISFFLSTSAFAVGPHITSVSQVWARGYQTIQIVGSGFGSVRPYDGDSAYIEITDLTQNWSAGHTGDAVTVNIGTWSDTLISINYFDGSYGVGNQSLLAGDRVSFKVWNAQSGAGPGTAQVSVLADATGLYDFGSDAQYPQGSLIMDSANNFYGTAGGGVYNDYCFEGCGTIYELSPSTNGTWTEGVLHYFQGGNSDGSTPTGTLVRDAAGNLYGVTSQGGPSTSNFCGTIFAIIGGNYSVLHNFGIAGSGDGCYPRSGMTMDSAGNMYGTTWFGGSADFGTVYELVPNGSGGWNYSVIYNFLGGASNDGGDPISALTLDAAGNLYGTTEIGGDNAYCFSSSGNGCGTVYELSPTGEGVFTERVLYVFKGQTNGDLIHPTNGVTFDSHGNLYGVISYGGSTCGGRSREGCGAIYILYLQPNNTWAVRTVYDFSADASNVDAANYPTGDLAYYNGVFYGYAHGGASQEGTIYTITPSNHGTWTQQTIYSFGYYPDGAWGAGSPIFGADGTMYGVTTYGGLNSRGVAFSLP